MSTPAGSYQLSSPLCAVADAAVARRPFPLIVYDHGGGTAGTDGQRIAQLPLHEALASHGFIVVLALHSADAVDRIRDLGRLTDLMLARNASPTDAFVGRIDPERIGTSGVSAGGAASFNFAAGRAAAGIAPDPRIKAMVVYEPARPAISLADASTLAHRVGVRSVRPLGVDLVDSFTDSPPFLATDAVTLAHAVSGETMVPS